MYLFLSPGVSRTWACTDGIRRAIHITASSPCDFDFDTENASPEDRGTGATPSNSTGGGDGGDGSAGTSSSHPLVVVSSDCKQSSFGLGMVFATVVAQGGIDTSFTVVASLLGKVGPSQFPCVLLCLGVLLLSCAFMSEWFRFCFLECVYLCVYCVTCVLILVEIGFNFYTGISIKQVSFDVGHQSI